MLHLFSKLKCSRQSTQFLPIMSRTVSGLKGVHVPEHMRKLYTLYKWYVYQRKKQILLRSLKWNQLCINIKSKSYSDPYNEITHVSKMKRNRRETTATKPQIRPALMPWHGPCHTLTVRKNNVATLNFKCYVLHSCFGTIFSHNKLLANNDFITVSTFQK